MEKRSAPQPAGPSIPFCPKPRLMKMYVQNIYSQEMFDRGNPGKKRPLALGPDVSETKGTFVKSG
jgi:hypothetical protein